MGTSVAIVRIWCIRYVLISKSCTPLVIGAIALLQFDKLTFYVWLNTRVNPFELYLLVEWYLFYKCTGAWWYNLPIFLCISVWALCGVVQFFIAVINLTKWRSVHEPTERQRRRPTNCTFRWYPENTTSLSRCRLRFWNSQLRIRIVHHCWKLSAHLQHNCSTKS